MKKKFLGVLLSACMVMGTFAGCGQTEAESSNEVSESSASGDETKAEESSSAAKEEEIVTVTWCMATEQMDDDEMVLEEVNKLLAERYNLELNLVAISTGEYSNRMQLMSTSGEDYDICFTSDWLNKFSDNVAREAFLPLDDLLESEAAAALMEVYPEGLTEQATVNGNIYAIPNYQLIYTQSAAYVQKDLADKYKLDYSQGIDTIMDIEWFLEEIRDNEPDLIPLCETDMIHMAFRTVGYEEFGYGIVASDDPDYTVIANSEYEGKLTYYKHLRDYFDRGLIRSDVVTVTDNTADKAANKYAVMVATRKPGGEAEFTNKYGKEYVQIPIGEPVITMRGAQPTMLAINVNSKNPEAAIKMIGAMWTDVEIYNMLVFGLEGEHYNKVGENRVEMIEAGGYDRSSEAWAMGNQFNAWLLPGQEDGVWEETEAINRSAKMSPLAGWVYDNTAIETERAQCKTVEAEYKNGYYTCDDVDAWFAQKAADMREAGVDKIVAEYQRQINEWRAANGK